MTSLTDNAVSVAILAGGASRRMGQNKAFILLEGKPLIQHVIDAVIPLQCPVVIIANDKASYTPFGLPVYADLKPGCGSLGGIYTALKVCTTPHVLCLACDMPFVDSSLLRFLIGQSPDEVDAVVPRVDGRPQPLHAVFHQRVAPTIAQQLNQGSFAIYDFLSLIRVSVVCESILGGNRFNMR
ncbi:MAG: molybdenum cofactor guanylyltransferase, partial [Chloroflexota bacterium]